jgi:hypothetical protein
LNIEASSTAAEYLLEAGRRVPHAVISTNKLPISTRDDPNDLLSRSSADAVGDQEVFSINPSNFAIHSEINQRRLFKENQPLEAKY